VEFRQIKPAIPVSSSEWDEKGRSVAPNIVDIEQEKNTRCPFKAFAVVVMRQLAEGICSRPEHAVKHGYVIVH